MEAKAIAKGVGIAPRKARLVIDLIRGKSVIEADNILNNLNKEELKLLRLRYIDGMSQTNIAKNLNMSQVQVSRYETKIKTKLKQELM